LRFGPEAAIDCQSRTDGMISPAIRRVNLIAFHSRDGPRFANNSLRQKIGDAGPKGKTG
jgi:hypothetical protein